MSDLNNKTLRPILASCFGVDEKYIIPKQGNWFNPQSMLPTAEKPLTWIAYKILSNTPMVIPYYSDCVEGVPVNYVNVPKVATIQLQFVGTISEELANSMIFWLKREDVMSQFYGVRGALLSDNFNVISSDFFQDGNNNITAYNVIFKVFWLSVLLTTQETITNVEIEGGL